MCSNDISCKLLKEKGLLAYYFDANNGLYRRWITIGNWSWASVALWVFPRRAIHFTISNPKKPKLWFNFAITWHGISFSLISIDWMLTRNYNG